MSEQACLQCKGTKITVHKSFTSIEGKVYPERSYACVSCNGKGTFPPVDQTKILIAIMATKGKNKGKLRASMVSPLREEGCEGSRAYYVWRLARFHGGKDMTLPMTADLVVRGDPFKKELDSLADEVAKVSFGTDLAAAYRWGRAFGMV